MVVANARGKQQSRYGDHCLDGCEAQLLNESDWRSQFGSIELLGATAYFGTTNTKPAPRSCSANAETSLSDLARSGHTRILAVSSPGIQRTPRRQRPNRRYRDAAESRWFSCRIQLEVRRSRRLSPLDGLVKLSRNAAREKLTISIPIHVDHSGRSSPKRLQLCY